MNLHKLTGDAFRLRVALESHSQQCQDKKRKQEFIELAAIQAELWQRLRALLPDAGKPIGELERILVTGPPERILVTGVERIPARCTGRFVRKPWTEQELKLLGTAADEVIAIKLCRTITEVRKKRKELGIISHRDPRRKKPR
jgi:hypothetical protein